METERLRALFGTLLLPAGLISGIGTVCPAVAQTDPRPMSAIDWLSGSVSTAPQVMAPQTGQPANPRASRAVLPPVVGEPPVTTGIVDDAISIGPIGRSSANGIGLLPAAMLGLPDDLWGASTEERIATLIRRDRADSLPSVRAFLMEIVLSELAPPATPAPGSHNMLFLARVDRLLDMGALDQAMALLEQAESSDPEVFRRRFDVALLLGEEDKACAIMADTPDVAPSFPARIFCLARRGDWPAAATSLENGRALGRIDAETDELLVRFLEPELAEDSDPLPPPTRPSPLVFRLFEAIGEPLPTGTLPLAFAQADLRANTGWKSRLEAAERLTRAGALDPNQLFGLYTEQRASASGGVWDRVRLISGLDTAIVTGKVDRLNVLLPAAWAAMQAQELEPALASMFAGRLQSLGLTGEAGEVALRLGLLSPDFQSFAQSHPLHDLDEGMLAGIAAGDTSNATAQDQLGLMLKGVFDTPQPKIPDAYATFFPDQRGEALLRALDDITEGAKGDYRRAARGLIFLRSFGQEQEARRIALELVVLERNG